MSPAKAERILALAEKLAEAAKHYGKAAAELRARENDEASKRIPALNAAREARRAIRDSRSALIAECEAPEAT